MSTGMYRTCDMCKRIELGDTSKWGTFYNGQWVDGTENFDLCPDCSLKVQMFIRHHEEDSDGDVGE